MTVSSALFVAAAALLGDARADVFELQGNGFCADPDKRGFPCLVFENFAPNNLDLCKEKCVEVAAEVLDLVPSPGQLVGIELKESDGRCVCRFDEYVDCPGGSPGNNLPGNNCWNPPGVVLGGPSTGPVTRTRWASGYKCYKNLSYPHSATPSTTPSTTLTTTPSTTASTTPSTTPDQDQDQDQDDESCAREGHWDQGTYQPAEHEAPTQPTVGIFTYIGRRGECQTDTCCNGGSYFNNNMAKCSSNCYYGRHRRSTSRRSLDECESEAANRQPNVVAFSYNLNSGHCWLYLQDHEMTGDEAGWTIHEEAATDRIGCTYIGSGNGATNPVSDYTGDNQWRCYIQETDLRVAVRDGGTHLRLGRANEEAAEERL